MAKYRIYISPHPKGGWGAWLRNDEGSTVGVRWSLFRWRVKQKIIGDLVDIYYRRKWVRDNRDASQTYEVELPDY